MDQAVMEALFEALFTACIQYKLSQYTGNTDTNSSAYYITASWHCERLLKDEEPDGYKG
jgi:hypothetical protein